MQSYRAFMKRCAALLLLCTVLSPAARGMDVLYVGDGGDNTIKAFDPATGTLLWTSQGSGISGLAGPRGIIINQDMLLVVNQNADLGAAGEVLRYHALTGQFEDALISSTDATAPFAPDGIVRGLDGNDLFVANMLRKPNFGPKGRVNHYASDGTLMDEWKIKGNEHHPRGLVFGPDGLLYVTARDFMNGLGGTVLRISADGKAEVFIDDKGGPGQLNRPDGLTFGPDGRLYVTSFQAAFGDTDSIRIYEPDGIFVGKIDLDDGMTMPRTYAQSLLFGPEGKLFVPILTTGEIRCYNTPTTGDYSVIVSSGGPLLAPWYMTFSYTNPSTLAFDGPN